MKTKTIETTLSDGTILKGSKGDFYAQKQEEKNMETLTSFLKQVQIGDTYVMTWHKYGAPKLVGKPRKVIKKQSKALVFESETSELGSFLTFQRAADYRNMPNGFQVWQDGEPLMKYEKVDGK